MVKAVLLSCTLLIILAAVNANDLRYQADSTQRNTHDTTLQWLSFDSAVLKIRGLSENDTVETPVMTMNKQAMRFVDDYLGKNSYLLKKLKDENAHLFTIMDSVFTRHGLPVELKYLAIVESRLKVNSVSRAGAAGAWQLMPVAARMYSLKITGKYDERRNFYKSTVAAAKLLKDLHKKFGDWLLVIAAYNSGPGGVYKAMKRSGSRNFWKLQPFLPAETRSHVMKFIGTHYYYEEQGSIATVCTDEIAAYRKKMTDFVEQQNLLRKEKLDALAALADVPVATTADTMEKETRPVIAASLTIQPSQKEK